MFVLSTWKRCMRLKISSLFLFYSVLIWHEWNTWPLSLFVLFICVCPTLNIIVCLLSTYHVYLFFLPFSFSRHNIASCSVFKLIIFITFPHSKISYTIPTIHVTLFAIFFILSFPFFTFLFYLLYAFYFFIFLAVEVKVKLIGILFTSESLDSLTLWRGVSGVGLSWCVKLKVNHSRWTANGQIQLPEWQVNILVNTS